MGERAYEMARRGLATNFTETEVPLDYALRFRNRFINAAGGAEKRQGIVALTARLPNRGIVTGIHEYVSQEGEPTLFASAEGNIYRLEESTNEWVLVGSMNPDQKIRHVQMAEKLVFYNGVDRQIYIETSSATPQRLQALMEQGVCGASTSASALTDADITNWVAQTFVTVGDIVFNATRNAYGIVTAVTSARVTHTPISALALGFGNTSTPISGSGPGGEPALNDTYKIYDSIELNVVDERGVPDNVATIVSTSSGANSTFISVSADRVPNWLATETRVGDIVHNTTKNYGALISEIVSSGIFITPRVATTSAGDSLVLYKSAMPIASYIHVHYGRAYMIDSRNKRNIIASGANDIQDMTVDSESLETVTLAIGSQQPGADPAVAIATFQTYLVVGTERAIYAFRGTTPSELEPSGLFPQGIVSPDAFVNTGNDLAFVSPDGLLSVSLLVNTNNLQRSNLSEPIKNTMRSIIREIADPTGRNGLVQAINYQRRSWIVVKLASKWYVYNYANFVLDDGRVAAGASWSDFDGAIGSLRALYVRHNYDIALGGANGTVYLFDQGTFTDDGQLYETEYMPGWLNLEEPKKSQRVKAGKFITPYYEVGGSVVYTIEATGDFDMLALDRVTVTARDDIGGRPIGTFIIGTDKIGTAKTVGQKTPLRWRGTHFRLRFRTFDAIGPDVLAGFTIFGDILGRR